MKCPNCGRNIRSKNQCAHCGHVFDKDEQKQMIQEKETHQAEFQEIILPKSNKKKGPNPILAFIGGLLKLVIMVALVFLAFMFGPKLYQKASQFLGENTQLLKSDKQETQVASDLVEQNNDIDQETKDEESNETLDNQSETDSSESTSLEEEMNLAQLTIKDQKVSLDNYPVINIVLEFEEKLDNIDRETFKFKLQAQGQEKEINDEYSLIKEGNSLKISYNDPTSDVLIAEDQEQILMIESDRFNFKDEVVYRVPKSQLDQEQSNQFAKVIKENLEDQGQVLTIIQELGKDKKIAYTYNDQSIEADSLISWFILERVYQALDQETLKLDRIVERNPALVAVGDQGEFSQAPIEQEYSIGDLIQLIIQQQDVTAMNHLIQETGGPNDFNLWLNESDYFATKLTEKLSVDDNGVLKGAMTSAKDIALLLQKLDQNQLISEEYDSILKEAIWQTPNTLKFPQEGIAGIINRYEMTTLDNNPINQYYSGILESEDKNYLFIILVNEVQDSEMAIAKISQTLQQASALLLNNELPVEEPLQEDMEEMTPPLEENQQVQIIDNQAQNYQPEPIPEYSVQNVEGRGDVQLPIIRDQYGNPMNVTWYWSEENQRYEYYTGN